VKNIATASAIDEECKKKTGETRSSATEWKQKGVVWKK